MKQRVRKIGVTQEPMFGEPFVCLEFENGTMLMIPTRLIEDRKHQHLIERQLEYSSGSAHYDRESIGSVLLYVRGIIPELDESQINNDEGV